MMDAKKDVPQQRTLTRVNLRKSKLNSLSRPLCFNYNDIKMKLDDGPKEEARQVVFKDTKKRFDNKAYIVCPGEIQCSISDKDCDPALLQATVKPYNFSDLTEDKWFSDLPKMFTIDPAVCVIPDDCIDTTFALDMLFSQEKIAMLNMANSTRPGGFYLEGHLAQEESIFIRSNIYKYLDPECTSDQKDREHRHYPLPEVGGLYVPNVLAIRNHEKYCYSLCVPRHINVICVAGLNMTQSGVYFAEKHGAIIKNKIRTIFRIAAENGHTVLVLGALGCGQFKNPVDEVVRIFGEVIEESKGLFEAIVFSILPDRKTKSYEAFKEAYNKNAFLEKCIIDNINRLHDSISLSSSFSPQPFGSPLVCHRNYSLSPGLPPTPFGLGNELSQPGGSSSGSGSGSSSGTGSVGFSCSLSLVNTTPPPFGSPDSLLMNPNAKRTQQAYTCGQAPPPPFTLLSQGQLENFTVRVPRAFNQQPAPPVPLPAAKAATLTVGEPKEDNGNVPVSSIEAPSPKLL